MEIIKKALLGILRLSMGWIFFWAFIDKLAGLGYATTPERAWFSGGSPTAGFLSNAPTGPFADVFMSLSGSVIVDWLFMLGLLGVGISLILGIFVRLAAIFGSMMLLFMYLAVLPPANNPLLDDHIIYILVLAILAMYNSGKYFGLGRLWGMSPAVKKHSLLR